MTLQKLREKKVLVTGGAGFIGSEVVRQLSENGAIVTVLDNFLSGRESYLPCSHLVRIVRGDICDKPLMRNTIKDCEIVINVAALPFIPFSYNNPEEVFRVNVMGTMNTLWEAINAKTVERFVQISSSEVYGSAKYTPMDENHPVAPSSTYAVSKLASARIALLSCKEHDFPATVVRPFNAFGPNITQPYIVPEIIVQLLKSNGKIRLGNVESSRDFTYVTDTARAILLASVKDNVEGEVINVGSGRVITIRDLTHLIGSIMGIKAEILQDETRLRPMDVTRLVCDWNKAKRLLSWRPEVSLEDGLRRVIKWLKDNPEMFRNWVPYIERLRQSFKVHC